MATKIKAPNIDFSALGDKIKGQFRGINPNDVATWPMLPRLLTCVALLAAILILLWVAWLKGEDEKLTAVRAEESKLRETYKSKLVRAVNLPLLLEQKKQVSQFVAVIEKQLPGKAEMSALLKDINDAATGRNLKFEIFKPGLAVVKEYYAELPIEIKLNGRYHDAGEFAGDIAALSRIVTLGSLNLAPSKDGNLTMSAIARTYRYLDPEEVQAQRKAASGVNK
jgi:type IV pilus assembly protein PilO